MLALSVPLHDLFCRFAPGDPQLPLSWLGWREFQRHGVLEEIRFSPIPIISGLPRNDN